MSEVQLKRMVQDWIRAEWQFRLGVKHHTRQSTQWLLDAEDALRQYITGEKKLEKAFPVLRGLSPRIGADAVFVIAADVDDLDVGMSDGPFETLKEAEQVEFPDGPRPGIVCMFADGSKPIVKRVWAGVGVEPVWKKPRRG